jgi:transcriptional regulator with XRE-family HTH domain
MDLVVLLGRNVRAWRERRGMSQEQVALDAGMKRSYLSELERGLRNPSVRALGRLADTLDVKPELLLKADGLAGEAGS